MELPGVEKAQPDMSRRMSGAGAKAVFVPIALCCWMPARSSMTPLHLTQILMLQDAGGPKIPLRFGRVDVPEEKGCAKEGRLPGGCGQLLLCNSCCLKAARGAVLCCVRGLPVNVLPAG